MPVVDAAHGLEHEALGVERDPLEAALGREESLGRRPEDELELSAVEEEDVEELLLEATLGRADDPRGVGLVPGLPGLLGLEENDLARVEVEELARGAVGLDSQGPARAVERERLDELAEAQLLDGTL